MKMIESAVQAAAMTMAEIPRVRIVGNRKMICKNIGMEPELNSVGNTTVPQPLADGTEAVIMRGYSSTSRVRRPYATVDQFRYR